MAIDKGLYQAPKGLEELTQGQAPEIEVEIEGDAGFELEIQDMDEVDGSEEFNKNLVEEMDDGDIESLASELAGDIDNDLNSRKDWEKMYKDGITLLGLKFEERVEPWDGACGVFHPMITEAVVRFQAEAIMETFPAKGPVRTQIVGKETRAKVEAAQRVEMDMNYQLTEKMPEFRNEHERMLWNLPSAGSAFKKVYFDPSIGRQISIFIPAEDIVIPYGASEIASCHRVTHRMRKTKQELIKLQKAGFYKDAELGEPVKFQTEIQEKKDKETGFTATYDDRFELYEAHVDLDLPGFEDKDDDGEMTGIALPYVVTMIRGTNEILAIRRNWKEDDPLRLKRQHFVHYQYIPGYGAYGFGLFHLIGGFAKSATSILRQLVDAGTLSNLPGGLKSRGLRIKGDDTPIAPGEFRDVDVGSGTIRDNILPLPYKEPSAVLAGLMDKIIEEGRRFAATSDMQISDMSANAPVGTTLAILERTLKVMSAIQARIHYSMKQEFKLLKKIIAEYTPDEYTYEPVEGSPKAKKSDYDNCEVIPVSDPNAATMAQKIVQYQAVLQLAAQAPQLYNLPLLHRQMLDVLGIKNAAKLVPMEGDQKPQDPITENMGVLKGRPLKAFIAQDHEAHIKCHMAVMHDPKIMSLLQGNPQAPMMQAAMMAHINEHLGYEYRKQMEEAIGVPIPYNDNEDEDYALPPEAELQISRLAADASVKLLGQNKTAQAAKQAEQAAQDPIVKMQQQELQLKAQEIQLKQKKLIADSAGKADQLEIEKMRIASQKEIAAMQIGAKTQADKATLAAKQRTEGMKLGVDIAKSQAQLKQGNQKKGE